MSLQPQKFVIIIFVLDTSHVDYVLFEAAGLLKDGLIREWNQIPKDELKHLRSYLLQYVINHPTLAGYVSERIVQVNQGIRPSGWGASNKLLTWYFKKGNITVWMTSCFTALDSATLLCWNYGQVYLFGQIQTLETGGQPSPYEVIEYFLSWFFRWWLLSSNDRALKISAKIGEKFWRKFSRSSPEATCRW